MARPNGAPDSIIWHDGVVGTITFRKNPRHQGQVVQAYYEGHDIVINSHRKTRAYMAQSLMHEIYHRALYPLQPVDDTDDIDEIIVLTLDRNMTKIHQANPGLFAWIHRCITGYSVA